MKTLAIIVLAIAAVIGRKPPQLTDRIPADRREVVALQAKIINLHKDIDDLRGMFRLQREEILKLQSNNPLP